MAHWSRFAIENQFVLRYNTISFSRYWQAAGEAAGLKLNTLTVKSVHFLAGLLHSHHALKIRKKCNFGEREKKSNLTKVARPSWKSLNYLFVFVCASQVGPKFKTVRQRVQKNNSRYFKKIWLYFRMIPVCNSIIYIVLYHPRLLHVSNLREKLSWCLAAVLAAVVAAKSRILV